MTPFLPVQLVRKLAHLLYLLPRQTTEPPFPPNSIAATAFRLEQRRSSILDTNYHQANIANSTIYQPPRTPTARTPWPRTAPARSALPMYAPQKHASALSREAFLWLGSTAAKGEVKSLCIEGSRFADSQKPQLPNQRHKIVAKRGAAFTIMVSLNHDEMELLAPAVTPPNFAHDRLLASPVWARRPSSTPSSLPLSRTTPITSADTKSRSTRPLRSRSPRPNWKRSSSRVRYTREDLGYLPTTSHQLTLCSPPDRHRHPWLR